MFNSNLGVLIKQIAAFQTHGLQRIASLMQPAADAYATIKLRGAINAKHGVAVKHFSSLCRLGFWSGSRLRFGICV